MSKILLSIKPEYANKIMSGEKKFEYRKAAPQKNVDTILIYSTKPQGIILGEVLLPLFGKKQNLMQELLAKNIDSILKDVKWRSHTVWIPQFFLIRASHCQSLESIILRNLTYILRIYKKFSIKFCLIK